MSRVGVLSRLHNAVGNLATYIWLRQSFVAISFERCRYFLAHVACPNLPWQGLKSILTETFHTAGTVYYHTPEEREIPHCSRFKLNHNTNTNQTIHTDSRDLDIFVREMSTGTHNV